MAMAKSILAVAAVLAVVRLAAAAVNHPVGGDGAWDASGTNYNAWASKLKTVQGDSISFTYSPSHDVVEVTEAGYDACSSGSNAIKSYAGGSTTVKLTIPGKHYFICSVPGHCAAGMKLEVTVVAGATAPAPTKSKPLQQRSVVPAEAPAPAASSSMDVSTPTAPAPAPGPSSDAASVGMLGAKAVMGLAAGMALVLAM